MLLVLGAGVNSGRGVYQQVKAGKFIPTSRPIYGGWHVCVDHISNVIKSDIKYIVVLYVDFVYTLANRVL